MPTKIYIWQNHFECIPFFGTLVTIIYIFNLKQLHVTNKISEQQSTFNVCQSFGFPVYKSAHIRVETVYVWKLSCTMSSVERNSDFMASINEHVYKTL